MRADERRRILHLGAGRAHRADDELERRFDLRAIRVRRRGIRARSGASASPRAGRRRSRGIVAATRSTSAGGGVSLTNRRASFVAMKRAVDGCAARMSSTCSPSSSPPPALITWPSTTFSPASWICGSKRKPPPMPRVVNRPARERARHFGDVLLRVAAVDAERVQLHQLAAVVLVQPLRHVLLRVGLLGAACAGISPRCARPAAAGRPNCGSRICGSSGCGPFGSALIQLSR